jgi:hypothetical protein
MEKRDFYFLALDKAEVLSGVDVDDTDVITYDSKRYTDFRYFKSVVTRKINALINDAKCFKIGRSVNPMQRANDSDTYGGYDALIAVAYSRSRKHIEELEAYYNAKYRKDKPQTNRNKRGGSAGRHAKNGSYLYVALCAG